MRETPRSFCRSQLIAGGGLRRERDELACVHLYPCMQVKKTNEAKEQEGKKRNGRTRQLVGRVRAPRMWEDGTEGMRERERGGGGGGGGGTVRG